jgi:hypothetical protein
MNKPHTKKPNLNFFLLDVVIHICYLITLEAEAGKSQV